jgi:hypothetical protein
LRSKADILRCDFHVRYVPKVDIKPWRNAPKPWDGRGDYLADLFTGYANTHSGWFPDPSPFSLRKPRSASTHRPGLLLFSPTDLSLVTRTLVLSNRGLFLFAMMYPASKSGFDAENASAMDLAHLRQDITAVLEECYARGMRLPYLFVAVSLDGKLIGVRFTEAEGGRWSGCSAYRWQPECGCYHAPAHQRHDCRCHRVRQPAH